MSSAKKQHYVPQFLLRNFANDGDKIYSCRADNKDCVFGCGVQDIFTMNHVHTKFLDDGSRNDDAEDEFFEEKTAPNLFEKILKCMRRKVAPSLTKSEQVALVECVARLVTRDPNLFGAIAADREFDDKVRETIELFAASDAEKAHYLQPSEFERLKHNARADALPVKPELLIANLSQFGLVFQILKEHVPPLVVGNQIWVVDRRSSNAMSWLPIAYDAIIAFWGEPGEIEFSEVGHSAWVRAANTAIARQCFQIAGRSREDIRALAKHLTFKPRGES